jgi:hypothetical protein
MKALVQLFVIIMGVIFGIYLGGYVMLFGGIVDAINAIKATPLNNGLLAIGILKFMFSSLVGWGIFYLGLLITAVIEDV